MNAIKFSHQYDKLHGQKSAVLLQVSKAIVDAGQLTREFINYDTKYHYNDENGIPALLGYFALPLNVPLLILVFIGEMGIPFTTVRKWSLQKEADYQQKKGTAFEIVILDRPKEISA